MASPTPPLPPDVQTVVDTYVTLSATLAVPVDGGPPLPTDRLWDLPAPDPRVEPDRPQPTPTPTSAPPSKSGGRKP